MDQPELNIGAIGSVGHGKTQLIKILTGINTVRFEKEKEQNITIKLGYANLKIYKNEDGILTTDENNATLVKWASFVDCPGHDAYMSTMISGASIFDAVILLIAANEKCPMPQTVQHLKALQIMGNRIDKRNLVIVQNKLDLVSKEEALQNYNDIRKFTKNTIMEGVPVIPVCAIKGFGINNLLEYICKFKRNYNDNKISTMQIIRSFDVNKPGIPLDKIKGGVIGGTIINGSFKINDKIVIYPGFSTDEIRPIKTEILSLEFSPDVPINIASRGGLVGIGTTIDPYLTKSNRMVGQIVFLENTVNDDYKLFKKLSFDYILYDQKENDNFSKNEEILVHIGSNNIIGKIKNCKDNHIKIYLNKSVFAAKDDIISISKKIDNKWKMYAYSNNVTIGSSQTFEKQTQDEYSYLLESLDDISIQKNIVKIPVPIISRTTTGILWKNFNDICNVLNRSKDHVSRYILVELGIESCSYNKENHLVIKKHIKCQYFENILKKYIKNYVVCYCCKNINTSLNHKDGLDILNCCTCNAFRTVNKII